MDGYLRCRFLWPVSTLTATSGVFLALGLFLAASITDFLDGYLARAWSQQSKLGQMLDPIADKLLVGAAIIMLVSDDTIHGLSVVAAVIILSRGNTGLGPARISWPALGQRSSDNNCKIQNRCAARCTCCPHHGTAA